MNEKNYYDAHGRVMSVWCINLKRLNRIGGCGSVVRFYSFFIFFIFISYAVHKLFFSPVRALRRSTAGGDDYHYVYSPRKLLRKNPSHSDPPERSVAALDRCFSLFIFLTLSLSLFLLCFSLSHRFVLDIERDSFVFLAPHKEYYYCSCVHCLLCACQCIRHLYDTHITRRRTVEESPKIKLVFLSPASID
jgi:hypothetical protein